jgi:hypothetical protein
MNKNKKQKAASTEQKPKNPWSLPHITAWAGPDAAVCDAHDRLSEIKSMTEATLRLVNGWPDNQKSVQRAIEVRLRKLQKINDALLAASVADGRFVVSLKSNGRYWTIGRNWVEKLSSAFMFEKLASAISTARLYGRNCRVTKIESGALGTIIWG